MDKNFKVFRKINDNTEINNYLKNLVGLLQRKEDGDGRQECILAYLQKWLLF